jgi:hypothetical protein
VGGCLYNTQWVWVWVCLCTVHSGCGCGCVSVQYTVGVGVGVSVQYTGSEPGLLAVLQAVPSLTYLEGSIVKAKFRGHTKLVLTTRNFSYLNTVGPT